MSADTRLPGHTAKPLPASHAFVLQRLARRIATYAPNDGVFEMRLPGVYAIRRSETTAELTYGTYKPAACIVAQGAKTIMLGRDSYRYDTSRMLAFAVDLPIAGQIIQATRKEPYLALMVELDPVRVTEFTSKVYPDGVPGGQGRKALYVGAVPDGVLDAALRLTELMGRADDAHLLGPLVVDELLIRLLKSPFGRRVAEMVRTNASPRTVASAIGWIRSNFARPMKIEALAKLVDLSPSAFHQHFKAVTSMSPLQYQKVLRLYEARRLMLTRESEAAAAGAEVGYASASQFTREYGRLFGNPPAKDIARLRSTGLAAAAK